MKSIFKKDEKPSGPTGSSGAPKIWSMPPEMQREFEKGVKYNMKFAIRGLRRTGKSSLLARLHGRPIPKTYVPSPEISAATIRFQPKDVPEDHGAKLDIWDVVDVGIKAEKGGSSAESSLQVVADATTIDVYRGCNCVIFVVDAMNRESLDYVVREARAVPPTTAILVALNFTDLPKPHAVSERDVDEVCRKIQRVSTPLIFLASQGNPPEKSVSAAATWVPISAATGFGMELVRAYFEIPFAMLHIETLEAQMKGVYRMVEQHQAWLLSERALLNFAEREKAKPKEPGTVYINVEQEERAERQQKDDPERLGGGHAAAKSTAAHQLPPPQQQKPVSKPAPKKQQTPPPQDDSKITNDFFGDISDDDEAKKDQSSSSEEDVQPAPRRGGARATGTSPKQFSPIAAAAAPSSLLPCPAPVSSQQSTAALAAPPVPLPTKQTTAAASAVPATIRKVEEPVFDVDFGDKRGVEDDFFGADEDDEDDEKQLPSKPDLLAAGSTNATSAAHATEAPGKLDDGFFGSDEDDKAAPQEKPAPKAFVQAKTTVASDDDDGAPQASHRRGTAASRVSLRGAPKPPPKPVASATAVPLAIDIAALVAQMQTAIVDEPRRDEEGEDGNDGGASKKEKRPKKDKTEKKAKKDKGRKHRDSDDGGFDEIRD